MTFFGLDIPVTVTGVWAFVTSVTTGIFYLKKEQVKRSMDRAEKLNQVLQRFDADDVASTFYSIVEHGKVCFEHGCFNDETDERSVDKMLNWFSYLCYLRRKHIIARSEFEEFAYWITRSLTNDQILDYLECIYEKYDINVEERPFRELVRYGRRSGIDRIDVLWSNYIARMPSWQRVLERLCCNISDGCRYFRMLGFSLQDVYAHKSEYGDDADDLELFCSYLRRNYTKRSASSIFTCATGVSSLLGNPLAELASTEEQLKNSRERLEKSGHCQWANLSNYRNGLQTYFNFKNGIERDAVNSCKRTNGGNK